MNVLEWIYQSGFPVGPYRLSTMELIGVLFGLASAVGGMKRRVWAWPIGILGNVILFFVYINATFGADHRTPLFGQSARQIFFIATSAYGWWRWQQVRARRREQTGPASEDDGAAIIPRWATAGERTGLVLTWVAGVIVVQQVFAMIGAGWPAPRWYYWFDAWIFMGSLVATYAMARGWNEFWLAWIGVDLVGVPLLWHSGYIPTAVLYAFYSVFVIYGFVVWLRATQNEATRRSADRTPIRSGPAGP